MAAVGLRAGWSSTAHGTFTVRFMACSSTVPAVSGLGGSTTGLGLCGPAGQVGERRSLMAGAVEVVRRQPPTICRRKARPFCVDDREPHGISIALLYDRRLPERAFIAEPQAKCGAT